MAGVFLSLLLLSAGVWADLTLTDSGNGSGFTFETSPNVHIEYGDNSTTSPITRYFITSNNTQGTMHYGIDSDETGYYQKEASGNVTAQTSAFGSTWVYMGD